MLFMTLCSLLMALFISAIAIPSIIHVADAKHLMDEPDSSFDPSFFAGVKDDILILSPLKKLLT